MEHTSDIVAEGKLIGETTYTDRSRKYTEVEVDGVKIDYYDPEERIVHEVKKSNRVERAHIAQVKYYLYKLLGLGIEASGIIEYPKMRERERVLLEQKDREDIMLWEQQIRKIVAMEQCPPLEKKSICRRCSYFDFCYAGEMEDVN